VLRRTETKLAPEIPADRIARDVCIDSSPNLHDRFRKTCFLKYVADPGTVPLRTNRKVDPDRLLLGGVGPGQRASGLHAC
jgi:hypothetical protein